MKDYSSDVLTKKNPAKQWRMHILAHVERINMVPSSIYFYASIKPIFSFGTTMVKHCMEHAKRYQACQFHANYIHEPPEPLHPIVASWPFDAWGLDVVGPLSKSSMGQMYNIPRYIITDNGTPFDENLVKSLCEKLGFKKQKSSMYNSPANNLAEAFNKMLGNLLKKVIAKNKRDWHEKNW
ncbi:uncharacterized protein [Nicotiana tomentosiformis]|uniref:uncharacterized protein n=1 Tax=Nicotiana tomentosiformis TaxID=4098 RepID=UPI00051BEA94|nr:uncharacterized protein LOC104121298 [Nicotiana tomentosiformis]